jgi:hypothetical protein
MFALGSNGRLEGRRYETERRINSVASSGLVS